MINLWLGDCNFTLMEAKSVCLMTAMEQEQSYSPPGPGVPASPQSRTPESPGGGSPDDAGHHLPPETTSSPVTTATEKPQSFCIDSLLNSPSSRQQSPTLSSSTPTRLVSIFCALVFKTIKAGFEPFSIHALRSSNNKIFFDFFPVRISQIMYILCILHSNQIQSQFM